MLHCKDEVIQTSFKPSAPSTHHAAAPPGENIAAHLLRQLAAVVNRAVDLLSEPAPDLPLPDPAASSSSLSTFMGLTSRRTLRRSSWPPRTA